MVKTTLSTIIMLFILINTADTGHTKELITFEKLYKPPPKYIEKLVEVTAYTGEAEENGGYEGITCEGKPLQEGIIAADDLPLGTIVIINGKKYIVADIFGGNYKNRIDIYMENIEDAWKFGRRKMIVKVMKNAEI